MRLCGCSRREWAEPSEGFVRYITGRVYDGLKTKAVIDQFSHITKKALGRFLAERINERLESALQENIPPEEPEVEPEPTEETDDIVTTEEEWHGYFAVKAILSKEISPTRISIRDRKYYCAVLLDDTNRKPICRLHFNSARKYLGLFDEGKNEKKVPIESTDDIFTFCRPALGDSSAVHRERENKLAVYAIEPQFVARSRTPLVLPFSTPREPASRSSLLELTKLKLSHRYDHIRPSSLALTLVCPR